MAFNMSLRTSMLRAAQRRFTSSSAINRPFVPPVYNRTFRQNYMSDPSTYPIMVIMTAVTGLIIGMSVNAFTNLKDLRIHPSVKHETIQTWGEEKTVSAAKRVFGHLPNISHSADWEAIRAGEGLGVDHEKFVQQKAAQKQ